MKTITEQKPFEEIEAMLAGVSKVYLTGCGTCATMCQTGGKAEVRREARGKERGWKATIESALAGEAALVQGSGLLFVAHYSGGASGVMLHAFDAATGKNAWSAAPYGVGPLGHSKYSNVVRLRFERGHLVVYGEESAGRYVEVFDPRSGRPIAARRFY